MKAASGKAISYADNTMKRLTNKDLTTKMAHNARLLG